jgi:hypothetical protein
MRLYTRTGAVALTDPATGRIHKADEQGGFDFPDELSDRLHRFAVRGQPMWENDIERQRRMINEELERRKDPATLLSAVEQILNAAKATQAAAPVESLSPEAPADAAPVEPDQPAEPEPAAVKQVRKRAAAKPAAE